MPRRSGTTTVWSFASTAAIGDHMSPVLPKPWISTTAGPRPPTRTWIVASGFPTCGLRESAGEGVGGAWPDRAPGPRRAAGPAATRRKRRENVDETVADMLGSLGWGDGHPGFGERSPDAVTPVTFYRHVCTRRTRAIGHSSCKFFGVSVGGVVENKYFPHDDFSLPWANVDRLGCAA